MISARQLPKVSGTTKGEVIDPYVVLEMHGVEPDCNKYQTAVVKNNGFNPTWNEVKEKESRHTQRERGEREREGGEESESEREERKSTHSHFTLQTFVFPLRVSEQAILTVRVDDL